MSEVTPPLRDNTPLAVVAIVVTVFALALGDALVKGMSAGLTLWQIFTLRSIIVLPLLAAVVRLHRGTVSLWPRRAGWSIARSLMLTCMWVAYYAALPHVDLAVAAAAYYTLPLFIALFAALFLGEPVGRTGWAAIAIGFAGVGLVLQPDAAGFSWFALLPVLAAVLYALAMILTRSHCRQENVFVLSLWLNLCMLAVGVAASGMLIVLKPAADALAHTAFLLGSWSAMGAGEWAAMGVMAAAIVIGSVGAAFAYQVGRSSTVATFDFAYVAFAAIWGVVLFAEVPSPRAVLGIVLIVIAGVVAVRRREPL